MAPLPFSQFYSLPLRGIRPAGWLQDFLQRQAAGLTGNVAVSGYPYGYKFWGSQADNTKGSYAAWWPYEQTGYWIDGALKAGFLAGDQGLYQQALDEIDFAIEHAAADGFIGPDSMRAQDRWPYTVFFRAVIAQYEISGDPRYLDALVKHYRSTPHPMGDGRDVTGIEILLYLYEHTGQTDMLTLAETLYTQFHAQWPGIDSAIPTLLKDKPQSMHGVTFNEEAKLAAMLYCATGKEEYLRAVVHGYAKLEKNARLADGLHSSSEHIHGKTARDMHETCNNTDYVWTLVSLLQASGAAKYADAIEQVIFNALPGSITKDFRALQYFSCPNQVIATSASNHNRFMHGLNWMAYRPDHEVQCCPGNLHRAMPNFIHKMWMRTRDGGIAAVLYGPGSLQSSVGAAQTPLRISAQTRYPYEQAITFTLQPAAAVAFPFTLRIPAWCSAAQISLNGSPLAAELKPGSFHTLTRTWQPGDVLCLELPFTLALETWPDEGVSLRYGPLTLALPVPTRAEIETENSTTRQRMDTLGAEYEPRPAMVKADFPGWNLYPAGAWNYALCVDAAALQDLRVEWNPACTDPLDAANPALRLRVKARRVRGWNLVHTRRIRQFGHWSENGVFTRGLRTIQGDFCFTPPLPDPRKLAAKLSSTVEEISLIPYAATMLRVTVFPKG
jgi:uncharacterized protein